MQVAASRSGQRLTATDQAAERAGLHAGMPLADARALCPSVTVEIADPDEDAAALRRLALWCGRYSPWTAVDGPDGIAVDLTGCAHLFGGEAALLADLHGRLRRFGLTARLAIAPTLGAAWAAARHTPAERIRIAADGLRKHLAPLPLAALRLDEATVEALAQVGLRRIGDVLETPRAPLTARFGPDLVTRLAQALGQEAETFQPLAPPPAYAARRVFAEPIVLLPDVERTVAALAEDLAATLEGAGRGARRLDLLLYRVDGRVRTVTVRTSELCRHAAHISRLFRERLDLEEEVDTGFGIEVVVLHAFDVEAFVARQDGLDKDADAAAPEEIARLLDRFGNRFGFRKVVRFVPEASAVPERAFRTVPVLQDAAEHDWRAHLKASQGGRRLGRPLTLLPQPDPIAVLSQVPDGPPASFEWRRVTHRVARADGPERIGPEWWRRGAGNGHLRDERTRDYYRVEDADGRRFWLFREGLYERADDAPRWFLHGVFA